MPPSMVRTSILFWLLCVLVMVYLVYTKGTVL
jgi:hypothetical protein